MAEAADKGIPLEDYIKFHAPEPFVRVKLDRGERYLDQTRIALHKWGELLASLVSGNRPVTVGRSREQE